MHNEPMPPFPERPDLSNPPRPRLVFNPDESTPNVFRKALEESARVQALRTEVWLRRAAKPLLDEGFRIDELEVLESRSGIMPSSVLRVVVPRRRLSCLTLALRRAWRRVRPYRIPEGKAAAHVATV